MDNQHARLKHLIIIACNVNQIAMAASLNNSFRDNTSELWQQHTYSILPDQNTAVCHEYGRVNVQLIMGIGGKHFAFLVYKRKHRSIEYKSLLLKFRIVNSIGVNGKGALCFWKTR